MESEDDFHGGDVGGGDGDDDEERRRLRELRDRFVPAPPFDVAGMLRRIYGYGEAGFSAEAALQSFEAAAAEATELKCAADGLGDEQFAADVNDVMRCVQESYSALVAVHAWDGNAGMTMLNDDLIVRFTRDVAEKELIVQTVMRYVLTWTRRLKLKHRADTVYAQKFTPAGLQTHAWLPAEDVGGVDVSTFEKLLAFICTKAHNSSIWVSFIAVPTRVLADKLRICGEAEFPVLTTSRAWISFSDGLYGVYLDAFVPYERTAEFGVPPDLAACSYHAVRFAPAFSRPGGGEPLHPLLEVHTPLLDGIMTTQKLCGHTRFWLMALLGRCLYDLGSLDNWQIALYLKGRAGTGKSTLLNFLGEIYDQHDVVVIGNDSQPIFGLQNLTPETFLFIVPEVKSDFGVAQAVFQSLVSGERLSFARKHQAPFEGFIYAHGALAGNELPILWVDASGSIRRRLFVVHFAHEPPRSDGTLQQRLVGEEMPFVLRKLNWCYRQAVMLVGAQNLWQSALLSKHLTDQHDQIYRAMNPLRRFLAEGDIRTEDPRYWCPVAAFQRAFKVFCRDSSLGEFRWTSDFYDAPFRDAGLSIKRCQYRYLHDEVKWGQLVLGCAPGNEVADEYLNPGDAQNPMIPEAEEEEEDPMRV